jgi:hypothetical protein
MEYDWWVPHSLVPDKQNKGYDWWVPQNSLATDPNRTRNMIGGFLSASFLTIETWHVIGKVPLSLSLDNRNVAYDC